MLSLTQTSPFSSSHLTANAVPIVSTLVCGTEGMRLLLARYEERRAALTDYWEFIELPEASGHPQYQRLYSPLLPPAHCAASSAEL